MRNNFIFLAIIGWLLLLGSTSGAEQTLVVSFVGDIMLGRQVGKAAYNAADPCLPFRAIQEQLHSSDITIGNLECVFVDRNITGADDKERVMLPAYINMAAGLTFGGINVISLANNHTLDYGLEGLRKTMSVLECQKIMTMGLAETDPIRVSKKGISISAFGIYCCQEKFYQISKQEGRYFWVDLERFGKTLTAEHKIADLVVVFIHWFDSVQTYPSDMQKNYARGFLDAGADLVVGQGTHNVQTVEHYGKGVIVYSLGNFIFDQRYTETQKGAILTVRVEKGKRLIYSEIIPTKVSSETHYQVVRDGKPQTF